jgi:hypothetical protein
MVGFYWRSDFRAGIPWVSEFQFGASAGWALVAKEKETCLLPEEKRELDETLKREHLLVLAKASARLAGGHT